MIQTNNITRPAPLACDDCRRRHLRCNGEKPCARCTSSGKQNSCIFTASRRGLGRRSRRSTTIQSNSPDIRANCTDNRQTDATFTLSASEACNNGLTTPSLWCETRKGRSVGIAASATSSASEDGPTHSSSSTRIRRLNTVNRYDSTTSNVSHLGSNTSALQDTGDFTSLFYIHFFPAHPVLVPQKDYDAQNYPWQLQQLVQWIGQKFSAVQPSTNELIGFASTLLSETPNTTHSVQALVMLGILLHAQYHPKLAEQCISVAMRLAIELRMNQPSFAQSHACTSVQEESLRRTWWELYTVDVYLAALHRRRRGISGRVMVHPFLPNDTSTSRPRSLDEYYNRVFLDDEYNCFPTSCYRIEATQILERVLGLNTEHEHMNQDTLQSIENALASWRYNLPSEFTEAVDSAGTVDQMLFQAQCLVCCATIFLHFPRSDLPPVVPNTANITGGKEYKNLAPASIQHTIRTIAASEELSNLAALRWPLHQQSPLFGCAMILACIVQLAAASLLHQSQLQRLHQHRDRVVLMFGVLKTLESWWTVAEVALKRLKPIASMIFNPSPEPGLSTVHSTGGSTVLGLVASEENFNSLSWLDLLEPDLIF